MPDMPATYAVLYAPHHCPPLTYWHLQFSILDMVQVLHASLSQHEPSACVWLVPVPCEE